MKIEHIIAQYLYKNKKLTLQDIGSFYLSPNIVLPGENDKDAVLPDNAITFEYNMKAVQDEGLIDFIVQQTRKIKPLATSDLESFTILGRQFMNIGKPLPIEGLGILQKNQTGEYEFIQGHTIHSKAEPAPVVLREKNKEEIVFATPPRKAQNTTTVVVAVTLFLLLAAAAAFYLVFKNNKEQKARKVDLPVLTDSIRKPDTVVAQPVTQSQPVTPPRTDSSGFRVIIRNYSTPETAQKTFDKFTTYGHKLVQTSTDSVTFKIGMEFKRPLTDTAVVKDSLSRLFGGQPSIELY